ncbi:MAG TPA: DUF58 domain-containing protein [Thermoanaerobaculia bacterium]|nr:DUF58 domain-containing protein [Thermoanaerobaculia bacterium]
MPDFEFKGVVRFTKVGTVYLVTAVVLAISAVNTGNNALYIGVSLMLGSLLLSGLASRGGLKHLRAGVGAFGEVWAGRAARGTLDVHNDSRLWNVRDVVLTSESLAEPVLIPLVRRRQTVTVDASFLFRKRGLAHVNGIDSYTRYPFGFFLKKQRLRLSSEVVVYPQLLAAGAAGDRFRAEAGEQTSASRPGISSELHSFREYTRGDSLRHVHWKKSASLGRWIIKQTEAESSKSVHVVVDPYLPKHASEESFEELISRAASFVFHAAEDGFDVTLSLPRATFRARERESASPLFRALALLEPVYEPVHQPVDRHTTLFTVGGGHDAKSA